VTRHGHHTQRLRCLLGTCYAYTPHLTNIPSRQYCTQHWVQDRFYPGAQKNSCSLADQANKPVPHTPPAVETSHPAMVAETGRGTEPKCPPSCPLLQGYHCCTPPSATATMYRPAANLEAHATSGLSREMLPRSTGHRPMSIRILLMPSAAPEQPDRDCTASPCQALNTLQRQLSAT
jgi:hypothetical protein